jgi:hypothetical protein
VSFFIWEWRKKNLEIRKLKREVQNLEEERRRIFLPTRDEIEKILRGTQEWAQRRARVVPGPYALLEDFLFDLHWFLTAVLASHGVPEARAAILQQRLQNLLVRGNERVDTDIREPDPEPMYRVWRRVKAVAVERLDMKATESIEAVLVRQLKQRGMDPGTAQ